jgi:hypothetical protein
MSPKAATRKRAASDSQPAAAHLDTSIPSPKRRRAGTGGSPAPSLSARIGFGPDPPEHGVWEIFSEDLHRIPMYRWVNTAAAKLFHLVKVPTSIPDPEYVLIFVRYPQL